MAVVFIWLPVEWGLWEGVLFLLRSFSPESFEDKFDEDGAFELGTSSPDLLF